jgi:hypothetical protein
MPIAVTSQNIRLETHLWSQKKTAIRQKKKVPTRQVRTDYKAGALHMYFAHTV